MLQNKEKVLYPELSYLICGFCFKIHNELGRFRNEKQYADALEKLFKLNRILYEREKHLPPSFEGEKNNRNIIDFLVNDNVIIEIKAKTMITKDDYFQVRRYLISYGKKLGIIINFRQKYLTPKRVLG